MILEMSVSHPIPIRALASQLETYFRQCFPLLELGHAKKTCPSVINYLGLIYL